MSQGATVHPCQSMDPVADAELLERAMKGAGTDEDAINELLSQRTNKQRREIAEIYKSNYGKDLKARLRSELSGNYRRCVLYSFHDMAHVDAKACYKAIKGVGTDEKVLIDVLCTSTNEEIERLKAAYSDILLEEKQNALRRNLEIDITNDTSGDFECILVALCQARRETSLATEAQLRKDADELYEAGSKKLGTDESTFTKIMVSRSWESIRALNLIYAQLQGEDLLTIIDKETSGDYCRALSTIVKTAMNRLDCYAEILYDSMKGAGTHDDNLVRMILAHSEVDLADIRRAFDTKYSENLFDMINGDTSGDYRNFLLAILGA